MQPPPHAACLIGSSSDSRQLSYGPQSKERLWVTMLRPPKEDQRPHR